MKFIKNLLLLSVLFLLSVSCSKVPAGNVGVKVFLLGGDKGVDHEVLPVGRYWIGINEELYLFPTFTQNYVWTQDEAEGSETDESITFQSIEGMTIGGDIGISYHVRADRVSTVFEKYRRGIDEITDTFLRNMVRDAFVSVASTMGVEEIYGAGKTTLIKNVEELIRQQVDPIGIELERIYIIGSLRLPRAVIDALNAKITATQKAQQRENELREAEAQAAKDIALAKGSSESALIRARADAEALRLKRIQISKELNDYEAIQKWNGVMPSVTGGATPFIQLK